MKEEMEEVIRRHLGRPSEIELENAAGQKDKFKISPLPVNQLPKLYETMKVLKGTDRDPMAFLENINEEFLNNIAELGLSVLKPNYPDVDDSILRELVLRNAILFAAELWSQNMGLTSRAMGDIEAIKRARRIAYVKARRLSKEGEG